MAQAVTKKEKPEESDEMKFLKKHFGQLLGGKIVEVTVLEDEHEPWIKIPIFVIEKKGKLYQCEVYCDPEGNDGGFIHINEVSP